MDSGLMFLDCPAYLDRDGGQRCGLPAEVRSRFLMRSFGGPVEAAMIRCPAGQWFTVPGATVTALPPPALAGAAAATAGAPRGPRPHHRSRRLPVLGGLTLALPLLAPAANAGTTPARFKRVGLTGLEPMLAQALGSAGSLQRGRRQAAVVPARGHDKEIRRLL